MDFNTWIQPLLAVFVTLAGVSALVAVLINIGKAFGIVKDGTAGNWSLVLNGIFFVVMVALGLFAKVTPQQFDQVAQQVATILIAVLGLVTQFGLTNKFHDVVSGAHIPLLGYSHSSKLELAAATPKKYN
jgi:hypothetical protein